MEGIGKVLAAVYSWQKIHRELLSAGTGVKWGLLIPHGLSLSALAKQLLQSVIPGPRMNQILLLVHLHRLM